MKFDYIRLTNAQGETLKRSNWASRSLGQTRRSIIRRCKYCECIGNATGLEKAIAEAATWGVDVTR